MFNISPLFSLFKVYYHNFPGKNTRSRERTRPPLPHFRLSLAPLIFKSEKIPAFHQFSFDFFENTSILKGMFRASLSSRGLGHRVFIPATRVRIPMGMPFFSPHQVSRWTTLFPIVRISGWKNSSSRWPGTMWPRWFAAGKRSDSCNWSFPAAWSNWRRSPRACTRWGTISSVLTNPCNAWRSLSVRSENHSEPLPMPALENSRLGFDLLLTLAGKCANRLPPVLPASLTNIVRIMEADLAASRSLNSRARSLDICRITLLRQFQKYLDTTPQAHRNHLRMESARNLLENTNYPVK